MASSQLLHNRWFGKAVGAMAGLILTAPLLMPSLIGMLVGVTVGAAFDRWAGRYLHPSQLARLIRRPTVDSVRPGMQFTFAGMGRIAKSSGAVLPAHINYAEHLMRRLGFSAADRELAITWFREGKAPGYPFQELAGECLDQLEPVLLDMVLECLCRTTIIEDNHTARATLVGLTWMLGIDAGRCTRVCAEVAMLVDPAPEVVARAYEILQVDPGASDQGVKTAYRRQVSKHHPDRLADTANPRQIELAAKRMVELREALELIEASR